MGLINIRRDVSDAFYRYKMESLQTKIEGKGNGIKTVVVNLPSVAQSLARDPNYVIKYFAFELGAQTNTDPKDDRWIINGAHEAGKLQELLDGFIKKFVLCKKCLNPETDFVVLDPRILLDCKACGQRTDVDIRLKLSGFITKHQGKGGKKDKAAKKAARRAKKENGGKEPNGNASGGEDGSDNGSGANGDDGSDDEFEKIQSAAPEVEVKDDDWAVDMSEEAVKARQAQLPDEFKQKLSLGDDEDGEAGGSTVYDEFGTWILDQSTEKNGIDNVDSIEIYVKAKELGIESKPKTVIVLSQTLFDDNVLAQIPKRASMIKQIGTSEKHEKALLGGTERFVGSQLKEKPEVLEKVVKILQLYYHHDLISEEVAIGWGTKASKKHVDIATSKKVRRAAEPFIKWLQEADEESSEEEEEESDEE